MMGLPIDFELDLANMEDKGARDLIVAEIAAAILPTISIDLSKLPGDSNKPARRNLIIGAFGGFLELHRVISDHIDRGK